VNAWRIPKQLIDRKQWLVWRLEKDAERPEKTKLLKVPYYVDGGKRVGDQGDERDRRRLAVYAAALKAHPPEGREVGCGGLGLRLPAGRRALRGRPRQRDRRGRRDRSGTRSRS
jgi:hypothetical protein